MLNVKDVTKDAVTKWNSLEENDIGSKGFLRKITKKKEMR